MPKLPFDVRVARYDEPPPDRLEEGDLQRLCDAGRFREANRLAAWIDVEDDTIVAHGQEGGGLVGSTQLRLGPAGLTVPRVGFDVPRPPSADPGSAPPQLGRAVRPGVPRRGARRRGDGDPRAAAAAGAARRRRARGRALA